MLLEYIDINLIDDRSLSMLAHSARDSIIEFYKSEENQREFEEWKKKRAKEQQAI